MPRILLNPFFWATASGLFFGAAISQATVFTRRKPDPERARTTKWIFVCIHLSFALVFVLIGFLLTPSERLIDVRLLYFLGAVSGVFAFGFRFKRSFGAAVFVIVVVCLITVFLLARSLVAFSGETEIARLRVISIEEQNMRLEIVIVDEKPAIVTMDGEYFAPVVEVVIFEDYFVFLGSRTWYRFEGLTSFLAELQEGRRVFRQADTDYYLPRPRGISESLYLFLERNEDWLPGIKSVQVEIDAKRARELKSYSIRIQDDGGVQIIDLG